MTDNNADLQHHMAELAEDLPAEIKDLVADGQNWDAASFVNAVISSVPPNNSDDNDGSIR